MRIPIQALSPRYSIRPLTAAELPQALALCRQNPIYYQYYGAPPSLESLRCDLTALPPGVGADDKYFVGFHDGEGLAALLDLIAGYPTADTAYIGWFILAASRQGHGVGSALIGDILAALAAMDFKKVRLAYVKDNPQSRAFWVKNSFQPTGEEAELEHYTAVLMEHTL